MGIKLIEVSLPLDDINRAAAREKSIRHGHPSTLHLWWARRPLAAARAVLFSSIIDDPSSPEYRWRDEQTRDRTTEEIDTERKRLHGIISRMVPWEASNDEAILKEVRDEILWATNGNPPPVLDPFAGGGSIPLEAQRLGLEAHASDLNPVAVVINKALIEIPPKYAGQAPVNPESRKSEVAGVEWKGATGLAVDVRYYGKWMQDEAERRIGHLYPKVQLPPEQGGGEATVIAWLWARTVTCPNPVCGRHAPLVSSFWLSKKKGKETWVEPIIDQSKDRVRFKVRTGNGQPQDETVKRSGGTCVFCGAALPFKFLRAEGRAGRMKRQLMTIVGESRGGRRYFAPTEFQEDTANAAIPKWKPEGAISHWPGRTNVVEYGMTEFQDLFTNRQLVALTTFSELVGEAKALVRTDAVAAGIATRSLGASDAETNADLYANALVTYLSIGVSRLADISNTICTWKSSMDQAIHLFTRQAIPMTWDFAETQPFSKAAGGYVVALNSVAKVLERLPDTTDGYTRQMNAQDLQIDESYIISTDPPYYDNVGYADLSDFFYIWLRASLAESDPSLFKTLLVPKQEELVAISYRFKNGKQEADAFFEEGLERVFGNIARGQQRSIPFTVYYAFKQTESAPDSDETVIGSSTGWETMLEGLIRSGFGITATWPMRTEMSNRLIGRGSNALASSIVLACRVRETTVGTTTRNDFIRELKRKLPGKLKVMQQASIAPVDLAQAAIGPGMAIYSAYSGVLEPNGSKMRVRTALQLINQVLDEVLADNDSEYDRETGWAVAWFEQSGMNEAAYGTAETLATARNVSVMAMRDAGILSSAKGKVQLLKRSELPEAWSPERDKRLTDWEIVQHLIWELETRGQPGAASIMRAVGSRAEAAKDLAYRLYTVSERKGWTQEALAYNGLVIAWPDISRLAGDAAQEQTGQLAFTT